MYSDRYNYYTIQSDLRFTQNIDTKKFIDIILETGFLKEKDHQTFINNEKIPFMSLFICKVEGGGFAPSRELPKNINLISIVCTKSKEINQKIYTDILLSISTKIGWKVFLEEDENGNEFVEIVV
ncbi:hypothetical protein V9L05_13965 [Bernardetia sp. Wsw4-3y2]|uniref:hypothetical protein n=1 Tax=Bernardetia sp. Wsw4-3y2 TaxID=3127471 RepID=UPI0030CE689D